MNCLILCHFSSKVGHIWVHSIAFVNEIRILVCIYIQCSGNMLIQRDDFWYVLNSPTIWNLCVSRELIAGNFSNKKNVHYNIWTVMLCSTTSRAPHTYKLVPFDAYEQTSSYALFLYGCRPILTPPSQFQSFVVVAKWLKYVLDGWKSNEKMVK
jgi:hypothetical protein